MTTDSTRSIFQSASRFFSGTLLSRLSGVVRDIVMAFAFGTGAHVAAFLVAYRFAHLLRRLFGDGAMQSAFVPLFEALRQEDPGRAGRFYLHLMRALSGLLLLIIISGSLMLGAYLLWGHPPSSQEEVVLLTLIMLPSLFFICLYGLNASLLQCHHFYFIPGVSPVVFNAIWTLGILWLMKMPEQEAMPYLAGCIILASLGQWLFTVPKSLSVLRTYPMEKGKNNPSDLWRIGTPMLLGTLGVAAAQINNFMDAVFARFASLDGPAFLWYSVRIQQLPLALFGIALAGAVLPPLSRAYKSGNVEQYKKFIQYAMKRTTLFLIPLSFAMCLLAVPGISIVYGRGDFGLDSITGTTYCLWAYALGLWPMGAIQILAPAYYARDNYRTPTKASVYAMGLNIVLNGWFVFGLGWDAVSIAIATSISAWVNMVILAAGLYRREALSPLKPIARCLAATFLAGLVGSALLLLLDEQAAEPALSQGAILLSENLWHRFLDLGTQTGLFALGAIGTLLITHRWWK